MQVLQQLYQVGGDLNGVTWDGLDAAYNDANTYVLERPDGLIMFDCGCGDTMDQVFSNMEYWGLDPERITYCLLTHPHGDHAGGGHILKEHGVRFVASGQTADAVVVLGGAHDVHGPGQQVDGPLLVLVDQGDDLLLGGSEVPSPQRYGQDQQEPGQGAGVSQWSFLHDWVAFSRAP